MIATDSNLDSLLDINLDSVRATTFTVVTMPETGESVLEADGEIAVTTAARFRGALRYAIVCRPDKLIVDMSKVSVLDSTGLTILVAADTRCNDLGIRFMLSAPSASATRLLNTTGLDQVLTVVADLPPTTPVRRPA